MTESVGSKKASLPHFHLTDRFPDVAGLLLSESASLEDAKEAAIFVLDTNVLLMPYSTNEKALKSILETYKKLSDGNRLFIPAQVIREFALHRPEKLKALFSQLSKQQNGVQFLKTGRSTLLDAIPQLSEVIRIEKEIETKNKEYRAAIGKVLKNVLAWRWDDPVSAGYRDIFQPSLIIEVKTPQANIVADLDRRTAQKIPPGYEDSGKRDGGIGDVIVWHTILEIGREKKQDLIFVTGEKKADWWYQSENENLYPRFELVDEYRRESGARFGIVKFSKFLELFGVENEIVREVKDEEQVIFSNKHRLLGFPNTVSKVEHDFVLAVLEIAKKEWPWGVIEQYGRCIDVLDQANGEIRLAAIDLDTLYRYRDEEPGFIVNSDAHQFGIFVLVPDEIDSQEMLFAVGVAKRLSSKVSYVAIFALQNGSKLSVIQEFGRFHQWST